MQIKSVAKKWKNYECHISKRKKLMFLHDHLPSLINHILSRELSLWHWLTLKRKVKGLSLARNSELELNLCPVLIIFLYILPFVVGWQLNFLLDSCLCFPQPYEAFWDQKYMHGKIKFILIEINAYFNKIM
jgi:hypothetical protein